MVVDSREIGKKIDRHSRKKGRQQREHINNWREVVNGFGSDPARTDESSYGRKNVSFLHSFFALRLSVDCFPFPRLISPLFLCFVRFGRDKCRFDYFGLVGSLPHRPQRWLSV